MRIQLPMLLWHGKIQRILSIDFHPHTLQLATAGTDSQALGTRQKDVDQICYDGNIKIWFVSFEKQTKIQFQYGLNDHIMPVNCIKYSPSGDRLASASDDGYINIYQSRQTNKKFGSIQMTLMWAKRSILPGHSKQVLDIKWSPSGKYLISGGMDGRGLIWNVDKQMYVAVLHGASDKYVQGVALDPTMQYAVTIGSSRQLKIYKSSQSGKRQDFNFYCQTTLKKLSLASDEDDQKDKSFRLFFDDNVPTFYRRPDISPDGNIFAIPSGQWRPSVDQSLRHCCLIFRRKKFDRPCLVLPSDFPVVICKFNPLKYKLQNRENRLFDLDYTMILAVATINSVLIYSTQSTTPLYGLGNYHYASLTDLSWRRNQQLSISSSDGYCSFVIFSNGQLGQVRKQQVEVQQQQNKEVLSRQQIKPQNITTTIETIGGKKISLTIKQFDKKQE